MNDRSSPECICGIIMPISRVDDHHDEAHWQQVQTFIEEAIAAAGMTPQPVWHNSDFDVIQAKILQNLFEHEIIVCDVSTRNPNVMLELGMRLTTKQPTIIIAEVGTKLPFDTSVIKTEFYDPTLKYADIAAFVKTLTKLITDTHSAFKAGKYQGYLETFKFETVKPASVSVTGDVAIAERLDEMNARLLRLSNLIARSNSLAPDPDRMNHFYNALASWPKPTRSDDAVVNALMATVPHDIQSSTAHHDANPNIVIGSKVYHSKFGEGIVVEVDGNKLEAEFRHAGRKRLMHVFVTLLEDE